MRSIVYNGHDLSDVCSAQVVERVAHVVVPETMAVPGRAGSLLVAGRIPSQAVRVRLFLDPGFKASGPSLSALRHRLRAWLCSTEGGVLVLPDDPELEYHEAVLTATGDWSRMFEDGKGEVVFTLLDPVAYGMERSETGTTFEVGGTWATWPTFSLVASAGSYVQVGCGFDAVRLEHTFAGGENVVVNCETEAVAIDGVDSRAAVTLGSDFFRLEPGSCTMVVSGCSSHAVTFRERWL